MFLRKNYYTAIITVKHTYWLYCGTFILDKARYYNCLLSKYLIKLFYTGERNRHHITSYHNIIGSLGPHMRDDHMAAKLCALFIVSRAQALRFVPVLCIFFFKHNIIFPALHRDAECVRCTAATHLTPFRIVVYFSIKQNGLTRKTF